MLIRVEPLDWDMAAVFLLFDNDEPAPEDEPIRSYLAERGLEPKRTAKTTVDDRECEVWRFGSCYLGPHLYAISELQREIVES